MRLQKKILAKLTETANLTKMVNLAGENGKSGNLPFSNWITKGALGERRF